MTGSPSPRAGGSGATRGCSGCPHPVGHQDLLHPVSPSANATKCTGSSAGAWYDRALGSCFDGLATSITFNLTSLNLSLPKNLVFGIAYNTSDYGYAPYGHSTACHSTPEGCPYQLSEHRPVTGPDQSEFGEPTPTRHHLPELAARGRVLRRRDRRHERLPPRFAGRTLLGREHLR